MALQRLALPPHYNPAQAGQVWRVPYQERAAQARSWAKQNRLSPAADDKYKICLIAVDVQNTFCIPGFELYVGGRSGTGAVDDNRRLCEFIYRNLDVITQICPTMDTHQAIQIFHSPYFVNAQGEHPAPYTLVSAEDVERGRWKFNPTVAPSLGITAEYGQRHLEHYTRQLKAQGKYALTVWPYHAMLGGIGHALVPALEEAIFFHSIARLAQPDFEIKGNQPFTENYSVIGPEVLTGPMGEMLGTRNPKFIQQLQKVDKLYIAGQAKSHCAAWTVSDLLEDIQAIDPALAKKVHLLEDCTSPVVVPGVVDHTDAANEAYLHFAKAGMKIVKSTEEI